MSAVRADGPPDPDLPARLAARVSERVTAHSGMVLPAWVLGARVRERMNSLSLRSVHDYLALIESPRGRLEVAQLVELLRVGETRFFRHRAHVQTLIDTVIPELCARRPSGLVRAWSAGCASGEEAYTLAMLLAHSLPRPQYQISVLATDVSARAIATARAGEYPASAISKVPPVWRARGFQPLDNPGRCRVVPEVAQLVTFEHKNLLDGRFPTDMDIIWCRNVFIYFAADVRVKVAKRLARSLSREGVLFIGYSESLRDVSAFSAVQTPSAVVYRRAELVGGTAAGGPRRRPASATRPGPMRPARAGLPAATRAASRPAGRARRLRGTEPSDVTQPLRAPVVATIRLTGRYDGSGRLASELSAAMGSEHKYLIIDLDGVELLDDSVAPLLRRAGNAARAAGTSFELRASRPNIVRYLKRHGLPNSGGSER